MRSSRILSVVFIGVLLVGALYFRPLALDLPSDSPDQIHVMLTDLGMRDGMPYIDTADHTLVAAQTQQINDLLQNLKFSRRLSFTPLERADHFAWVFLYKRDALTLSLGISSTGELPVDDQCYRLQNAGEILGQIEAIYAK